MQHESIGVGEQDAFIQKFSDKASNFNAFDGESCSQRSSEHPTRRDHARLSDKNACEALNPSGESISHYVPCTLDADEGPRCDAWTVQTFHGAFPS